MRPDNHTLPKGYNLRMDFIISDVLGQGGFGITYAAESLSLGVKVALKEYFPTGLATRTAHATLQPHSQQNIATFNWAKERFLREASTLAQFRHPNIVRVWQVFEENNTAYAVLDFEEGQTLKSWLGRLGRPATQEELDQIAVPLLSALEAVHSKGLIHRDISPDNIIRRPDGSPVLIDFGSAKDLYAVGGQLTHAMVKTGYSPIEQYDPDSSGQGPWTDLYALAATFYQAISRQPLPQSTARSVNDPLPPATTFSDFGYRKTFLRALDHALAVDPLRRPQTAADWAEELLSLDADNSNALGDEQQTEVLEIDPPTPDTALPGPRSEPVADKKRLLHSTASMPKLTIDFGKWLLILASVLLLAAGGTLAAHWARGGGATLNIASIVECGLFGRSCEDGIVTAASREALRCLEQTLACDAQAKCIAPYRATVGSDAVMPSPLRQRLALAQQQCAAAPLPDGQPARSPNDSANSNRDTDPAAKRPDPVALPGGISVEMQGVVSKFQSCLRSAPCNLALCRRVFDNNIGADAASLVRSLVQQASENARIACANQREASAYAELEACADATPCAFSAECLAAYHGSSRGMVSTARSSDIERVRRSANELCTVGKR